MDNSMMLNLDPSNPHRPLQPHQHLPPAPGGGVDNHPIPHSRSGKGVVSPSTNTNTTSDDEEDGGPPPPGGPRNNKGSYASRWQRMKWTDDVVRLLIATVASVGDDPSADGPTRNKTGGGAALQKKGKWKTVSKLMLGRGCYVSPQQCEDKFNDLNKRYKRLNEILGRGTTCRVVENPALLDSMPQISAKAKDDVRKILSSKHLFYREMCAYHNGQSIHACQDFDSVGHMQHPDGPLKDGNGGGNSIGNGSENDDGDDDDDDDDSDDDNVEDDDNWDDEAKCSEFVRTGFSSFQAEVEGVLLDPSKTPSERREWFRRRALQLQEERVVIQKEAFALEKRWSKWKRFQSKKDREVEGMRLENERLILENEQMVMQVKHREVELELKLSMEIPESVGFHMEIEHRKDHQMDFSGVQ